MKKERNQIIERYGDPCEFDYAPFLSILVNINNNSAWVQLNKDDHTPLWERFDSLDLAQTFIDKKNH